MDGNGSSNRSGRKEMIVFLIFLVTGFFLTLHYIAGKHDVHMDGLLQKMDGYAWYKFQENFLR